MQIPLDFRLTQHCTFANYVVADGHEQAVHALQQLPSRVETPVMTYITGAAYSGKSHLLQAVCHAAMDANLATLYMPMQQALQWPLDVLAGSQADIICIDDVSAVAGHTDWERTLYGLVNDCQQRGASIVAADRSNIAELDVQLADLKSRLSWGGAFTLVPPAEIDAISIVKMQSAVRGLDMSEDVQGYLLKHYHRDLSALLLLLDELDHQSMVRKRRLTIPFVKSVIAEHQA